MKKLIYSMLFAALVFTGCSSVEPKKEFKIEEYKELALAGNLEDLQDYEALETVTRNLADDFIPSTVGLMVKGLNGMGSGVIVSEEGIIMTAAHVIGKPGAEVTVFMSDGRRLKGKGLGVDYNADAALVKIINEEKEKFPYIEMGKSSELKKGQFCMAMGHAGGILKGRKAPLRLGRILVIGKGTSMKDNIISDATVISGDSGGPLFDLTGKVIGINSSVGVQYSINRHVPVDIYHEKWDDFLAGKAFGKKPDYRKLAGKPPKSLYQLLKEKAAAKDPEALKLMAEVKKNGGKLKMTRNKQAELMKKWGGTPNSAMSFSELLKEKVAAKDPEALKLMAEAKKNGGKLKMTRNKQAELMKKWGGTPPKSFSQLLKEKVAAKDPEALKLMAEAKKNGGKLKMTKNQQAALMKKWGASKTAQAKLNQKSFSFKNSDIKPEIMKELKKYGKIGPDGKFKIEMTPQNASELKPLLEKLGLKKQALAAMNKVGQEKNGKGAEKLLKKFNDRTENHAAYTAQVLKDGKQVALGIVISEDGYIITKSSEVIFGEISCKIGEETFEAKVLRSDNIYDVALIKIDAEELTPVQWNNDITPAERGTWLLSPNHKGETAAIGILSHEPRMIRRKSATVITNTNKVFLGVVLDHQENIPNVLQIVEGGAAEEAGIKKGDRILSINGAEMKTSTQVVEELGKFKVDDTIKIKVLREEKEIALESKLKPRNVKSSNLRKDALEKLSLKGGTISKRNSAFPVAITHDCIIQANQCGGLLLNLKGEIIGMNIARANRTATYAIPVNVVEEIIEGLMD